jgi:hypothetical protein
MDEQLPAELQQWLRHRRGTWQAIADQSGLNYWWIQRFAQNRIPKPGYDKIQKLAAYRERVDAAA